MTYFTGVKTQVTLFSTNTNNMRFLYEFQEINMVGKNSKKIHVVFL